MVTQSQIMETLNGIQPWKVQDQGFCKMQPTVTWLHWIRRVRLNPSSIISFRNFHLAGDPQIHA